MPTLKRNEQSDAKNQARRTNPSHLSNTPLQGTLDDNKKKFKNGNGLKKNGVATLF